MDCGAQAERLAYELTEAQRRAKSLQEALYREREAAIGHATSAAAAQSVPSSVTSVPLCPFPSHRSAEELRSLHSSATLPPREETGVSHLWISSHSVHACCVCRCAWY